MILCIDAGNTHLYGGVYQNDKIIFRFRYNSKQNHTSDQIGIFLKSVLEENGLNAQQIERVSIGSVVPSIDYSLRAACIKYLDVEPFVLQAGVKTGLKIRTNNPNEVGADLIASAIAAIDRFPQQPIIVADFGTATTFSVISPQGEYLGVTITPGFKLSISALQSGAELLPSVEIKKTTRPFGKNTIQAIQAGLYYSQLAMLKEISQAISDDCFQQKPMVIGTGGFVHLLQNDFPFDAVDGDLVLNGLYLALLKN